VQILLYAGGVVTVVVFAIVVTERLVGTRLAHTSRRLLAGGAVAAVFLGVMLDILARAPLAPVMIPMGADPTKLIGMALMTRFLLPFELLAVLLLVSLLAASYLARPEE